MRWAHEGAAVAVAGAPRGVGRTTALRLPRGGASVAVAASHGDVLEQVAQALEQVAQAFASHWAVVGDCWMHARVSASAREGQGGRPVVVVHGLGAASEAQLPVARLLASRWPVYVPDLPGFGRSQAPAEILDIDDLADRLAAWAEALDLPPAAYVGNSAGCQVVTALAQRHPRRVDRLVLQGPTVDPQHRTALRQAARFALDAVVERPSLGPVQVRGVWQAGVRRLVGTFRAVLADRIEQRLPEITCPVLVVRGSRDAIVPQRWARQAAALAPAGRLAVAPGAPHCMVYSAPRQLAGIARGFLAGNEDR